MRYNWKQSDWPEFSFDKECIAELLVSFAEAAGRASGYLKGLTEDLQSEAVVNLMVSEAGFTGRLHFLGCWTKHKV